MSSSSHIDDEVPETCTRISLPENWVTKAVNFFRFHISGWWWVKKFEHFLSVLRFPWSLYDMRPPILVGFHHDALCFNNIKRSSQEVFPNNLPPPNLSASLDFPVAISWLICLLPSFHLFVDFRRNTPSLFPSVGKLVKQSSNVNKEAAWRASIASSYRWLILGPQGTRCKIAVGFAVSC